MRATWNNTLIAESDDTVLVEGNYYFPESTLNRDVVTFSNHKSSCAWKGEASYYSLNVNGELNLNAVWYPAICRPCRVCSSARLPRAAKNVAAVPSYRPASVPCHLTDGQIGPKAAGRQRQQLAGSGRLQGCK